MHRFFPIRVAEKNINRATSVCLFGALNNDGIPNLCVAIAHNFLSNIHDELFTGYTKLAIGSCIAVDLELQLIVTRHGIPSLIAGDLWRTIFLRMDHRSGVRGPWRRIPYFSKFWVDPAVLSCSKAHSSISSPRLPSFRFSRAANSSSSARKACRTRRLSCAFHSPIAQPLTYDAKHLEAKRALAVDEAFDEPSERRCCHRSGRDWFSGARASNLRAERRLFNASDRSCCCPRSS